MSGFVQLIKHCETKWYSLHYVHTDDFDKLIQLSYLRIIVKTFYVLCVSLQAFGFFFYYFVYFFFLDACLALNVLINSNTKTACTYTNRQRK